MKLLIAIAVLSIASLAFARTVSFPGEDDEITDLPGLKTKPKFRQYSGYLDATDTAHLHYWFVESENDPQNDPVVLWMNGGPGCSSLGGFLSEQGPFHVDPNDTKSLTINDFAWNKIANVIFLEAPAGVGYSYKDNKNYHTNDDKTAEDNYVALQSFFKKFPPFQKNDFYVTGESYGGIYVPTLSVNILRGKADINFKGFAVGNGLLNDYMNGNSQYFFEFYHGLQGTAEWNKLTHNCCINGSVSLYTCNFISNPDPKCGQAVEANAAKRFDPNGSHAYINPYNIYDDCNVLSSRKSNVDVTRTREYYDRMMLLESLNLHNNPRITELVQETPVCITGTEMAEYLSLREVRKALHIPDDLDDWVICGGTHYLKQYHTMKPQILELVNSDKKLRGIIYNGDVDSVCNYLGDEWFVDDLGLKLAEEYAEWDDGKVVGGWKKRYAGSGPGLTYVTVRGSGHMVPHDKPSAALHVLKFLFGQA